MNERTLVGGATIAAARRALAAALRAGAIETPELDARILVGHALGLDHGAIIEADRRPLSDTEARRIAALAERRLAHEPVARICGRKEFWSLDLRITPDVLVPRPETETLVEAALAALGEGRRNGALAIADLGTGSGALLIALLRELPRARGVATDRSEKALRVARANTQTHAVAARATFVACDYGTALGGGFDLVVANPPYVRSRDIATLAPEVRDHDPTLALDGGDDGLHAYRAIAADSARLLGRDGLMIVECGFGQADAIAMQFVNAGLSVTQPARVDLSGIPRALVAKGTTSHSLSRKKALGMSRKND